MKLFEVGVAPSEGAGVTLTLTGELDLSTVDQLEQAIADNLNSDGELVVMDLRELSFLDSTGLRLMLRLDASLKEEGRRLVLVKGPRRVQRVFELTRAVDELEIVEDPGQLDGRPGTSG